jgi:hypothetical protein
VLSLPVLVVVPAVPLLAVPLPPSASVLVAVVLPSSSGSLEPSPLSDAVLPVPPPLVAVLGPHPRPSTVPSIEIRSHHRAIGFMVARVLRGG